MKRLGWPEVDLIVDCRCFSDPHGGQRRNHIGVHPDIIDGICQSRQFRNFFNTVRRDWNKVREAKRSKAGPAPYLTFVVVLFCLSGRHRGPAVSEILSHVFQRCDNFRVKLPVVHLASEKAWARRTCQGKCQECMGVSATRDDAFAKAANIWRGRCP